MHEHVSVRGFTLAITQCHGAAQEWQRDPLAVVGAAGDRTLYAWLAQTAKRRGGSEALEPDAYVLGDDQDADSGGKAFLGYGVPVYVDRLRGQISLRTSLSGFPPVFLYEDGERSVITSAVERIAAVQGVQLAFDPQGLVELASVGYPLGHRTLFRNLSVIPPGTVVAVDAGHGVRSVARWEPETQHPFPDLDQYLAAQRQALAAALSRTDLSRSFLSLTAGLDSRTVLALLVRSRRAVPALTISSKVTSLDARRAAALCRSYGIPHSVIRLDDAFLRQFADCALEASRRSGGLASFRQAAEVYFYRVACRSFTARLSGNLGNQIGRSAPEGVTMRNVDLAALANDIVVHATRPRERNWFEQVAAKYGELAPLHLIQQENLFASMANFCIGASYATQQTPYADRTVISQKLREPVVGRKVPAHRTAVRLRDLKHRFLGTSIRTSFQRQIVAEVGGSVAHIPVNWGWRASGFVSAAGVALGSVALFDMFVNTQLRRRGVAARFTARVGIDGLGGFQYVDLLRERPVAEFVRDALGAPSRCSSVLNPQVLRRALAEGFDDPSARRTLLFALDVALAERSFGVAA